MIDTPVKAPSEVVYLIDLDGTGSMHVCSKGDPDAIEYVPSTAERVSVTVMPLEWETAKADKAPAEVEPVAWMTREVNVLGVGGFHEYLWPTLERAEQHQKTCGMWLCQIVPLYAAPTLPTLKPEGKQTREAAIRALDQLINEPLSGPTHGAWDRGRLSGLKEARALLTEGEAR